VKGIGEEQLPEYLRAAEPVQAPQPVPRSRLKHLRLF
jgi:hypothetical protein